MEVEVPDKLYFKIGEAAELASLKPSILRYWETEFPQIKPVKSPSGQRLYTRKNVEVILEIRKLLYTERLTIEGARKRVSEKKSGTADATSPERQTALLREIREDLIKIRDSL